MTHTKEQIQAARDALTRMQCIIERNTDGGTYDDYDSILSVLDDALATISKAETVGAENAQTDGLLDPDMPAQELRLHMGELTASELLVARAAIRWANTPAEPQGVVEPIEGLEEALCAFDGNERFPTAAESRFIYEAARAYLTLTKREK